MTCCNSNTVIDDDVKIQILKFLTVMRGGRNVFFINL